MLMLRSSHALQQFSLLPGRGYLEEEFEWDRCDFSCDSKLVAAVSSGVHAVCVWDVDSRQLLRWFDGRYSGPVHNLRFSPCHSSMLIFWNYAPTQGCTDHTDVFIMGKC